jgi:uncharacterized membrane protein YccC
MPARLAAMFALAGAIGLAIGFRADLVHVAWAAGAALLIMRPVPDLTVGRAAARVVATFAGITVAALIATFDPTTLGIAVVTALAVAAIIGTRTSRWYLSSAGTGLVVLLMSGVSGADALATTYRERLLETAIGAALAIGFGVVLPSVLERVAPPRVSQRSSRS